MSVWVAAARPRTLPAAIAPVLIGTAIAAREGSFHAIAAIAALLGAVLIQIGTNFANDYFDCVKGADTEERLGPTRATAAGLVTPQQMKRAFIATFALAALVGSYLMVRGGLPIVAIGATGIACGVLYTGGPRPLGYLGLGDLLVFVFFGPVAVAGTHYVQALQWSADAAVAGLGPAALSTALLAVNNLRDVDTDRVAGKRTLAVRFGRDFAKVEFVLCFSIAVAVPIVFAITAEAPRGVLFASAACLLGIPAVIAVASARPGDRLLGALAGTGRLLAVYGVTLAAGWWLG